MERPIIAPCTDETAGEAAQKTGQKKEGPGWGRARVTPEVAKLGLGMLGLSASMSEPWLLVNSFTGPYLSVSLPPGGDSGHRESVRSFG